MVRLPLQLNRKVFLFYSDRFSLLDKNIDSIFTVDIPLQPIENPASYSKNIFFETNQYNLQPESMTELNKVVALLNDNPT